MSLYPDYPQFTPLELGHKPFFDAAFKDYPPEIPGLYQIMLNDFVHVNLEQDLGIPGLRASKQSYQPVKLIKKYTISLKE